MLDFFMCWGGGELRHGSIRIMLPTEGDCVSTCISNLKK